MVKRTKDRIAGRGAATRLAAAAVLILLAGLPAGPLRAAGAPHGARTGLPPVECVRLLRQARIARMEGDPAAELARLHHAADAFPDELAPTLALLEYHRRHPLPEAEQNRLEARLRHHLADPDHPLPLAVLRQITADAATGDDLLDRLAVYLEHRAAEGGEETDALLTTLSNVQVRLGRDADAAATLKRLLDRTPGLEFAWRLYVLDAKLERWKAALEIANAYPELRESLGARYVTLLARAGRLDAARAELERLCAAGVSANGGAPVAAATQLPLAGEPGGLTGLTEDLAWRYRDAGRDKEAEALFREALAASPDDAQLEAVLLNLYSSGEERREYAASVAESWKEETDPQALLDEGTQRLAAGDDQKAFDLLRRAAPSFPKLEAAWFNLGMAAERLERWSTVADALGHAAELNPDRAATFFFRGLALVHLERCKDAVPALERALELDPSKGQAHYYLAGCYRDLGKAQAAERERRLYQASRSGKGT